jgi:hypothetical protein
VNEAKAERDLREVTVGLFGDPHARVGTSLTRGVTRR